MKQHLKVEIPNKVFDKDKILEKAYDFVANLYLDYQKEFLSLLKDISLDDFYLTIFQ
jgi:hypothetical protein